MRNRLILSIVCGVLLMLSACGSEENMPDLSEWEK